MSALGQVLQRTMKRLLVLIVHLASIGMQAQSSDTLLTTTISESLLRLDEMRTTVDSLVLLQSNAAEYLLKDSRFQLRQYAPGSVATFNLGGANSSQSRVLWDGIDISSMASGTLDLSIVPGILLQSSSVLDGSNAGSFGSNGMAGGLALNWTASGKREFSTLIGLTSIGGLSFGVLNGGHFSKVNYRSFLQVQESSNSYPYSLGNQDYTMNGMGFNDITFMQQYNGVYKRAHWKSDIWFTQGEKKNSGSILAAGAPSLLQDKALRVKYSWQKRSHKISAFIGHEWQAYTDTLNAINLTDTNTYRQYTLQYNYHTKFAKNIIEVGHVSAGGTSRDAALLNVTARHETKLNDSWNMLARGTFWQGKLYGAGQFIWSSKKNKFPIQWSTGSFYRLPTMNELYWNPGGNLELAPERSYGSKVSALYRQNDLKISLTTDQLVFNNLIQWTPLSGGIWSPVNLERAYSSSSTLLVQLVKGNVNNEVSATHQYSRVLVSSNASSLGKQLIYRPSYQIVHTIDGQLWKGRLQLRSYAMGKRHTLRDNANAGILNPEFWMDLAYSYSFLSGQVQMTGRVHNLTNTNKTFIPYYPMPGRHYSINIKLNSKK